VAQDQRESWAYRCGHQSWVRARLSQVRHWRRLSILKARVGAWEAPDLTHPIFPYTLSKDQGGKMEGIRVELEATSQFLNFASSKFCMSIPLGGSSSSLSKKSIFF
jgi:hypothetical protein